LRFENALGALAPKNFAAGDKATSMDEEAPRFDTFSFSPPPLTNKKTPLKYP
jgi:hypothetical protein